MSELCPANCVNIACGKASWLQENETFLLTVIGFGGSALGVLMAYFLKSRCKKIGLCWGCLSCDRTILENPIVDVVEVNDVNVVATESTSVA